MRVKKALARAWARKRSRQFDCDFAFWEPEERGHGGAQQVDPLPFKDALVQPREISEMGVEIAYHQKGGYQADAGYQHEGYQHDTD